MTEYNDPLNGSTPPEVLAKALSGELAKEAGGDVPHLSQTGDNVVTDTTSQAAAAATPAPVVTTNTRTTSGANPPA